jgi:TIR domain
LEEKSENDEKIRLLRKNLIYDMQSCAHLKEEDGNDVAKLNRIVDGLEKVATMVGIENSKTKPLAESVVLNMIDMAGSASGGGPDVANLFKEFLGERIALASFDADPHVFICHSSDDKDFARKLATDLVTEGYRVWFDEWEIMVGDSLYEKIQAALKSSNWFIVVLSPSSVNSNWCKRELHNALIEEDSKSRVFVLPVICKDCEIPGFLKEKH